VVNYKLLRVKKHLWILALCVLPCFLGTEAAWSIQISGTVTDGKNPVSEARVRVHGQTSFVLTDAKGRFDLSTPDDPLADYVVTAGKEGWINGGVKVAPNVSFTTIVIRKVPEIDDPAYTFKTPHKAIVDLRENPEKLASMRIRSHTTFTETCNLCHFEPSCHLCHRDLYTQWSTSQHARAVTNPWTQDLYNGTDAEGNPNVGPGFRLDFPDKPGECADCHAPSAALRAPGKTDLKVVYNRGKVAYPTQVGYKTLEQAELERKAGSVDVDGIHCDFCHKIKEVKVNEHAGVNGSVTMTRWASEEEVTRRTPLGALPPIFAYGPYDDVISFSSTSSQAITSPMVASYNPIYKSSDYCSACHQHKNEHGLPFMDTYREWKESPYFAMNVQCQDCHMKPDYGIAYGTVVNGDAEKFWTPLNFRDVAAVRRHDFPGGTKDLVKNAAALEIDAVAAQGTLNVKVNVRNVNTGHHIPSGITIRNMLLLVTPVSASGDTLKYTGSQRVPEYGGTGPLHQGNYADYPGKGFALVFGDDKGGKHVMDWQATKILEDTRIKARSADQTTYTFALPPNAKQVDIHTRLIYRRAFKPLADIKKWKQDDMVVASDVTTVTPNRRLGMGTSSMGLALKNELSRRGKNLLQSLFGG